MWRTFGDHQQHYWRPARINEQSCALYWRYRRRCMPKKEQQRAVRFKSIQLNNFSNVREETSTKRRANLTQSECEMRDWHFRQHYTQCITDLHRLPTNTLNVNQMSTNQASTSRAIIQPRRALSAPGGDPDPNGGGGNGNDDDEDVDRRRRNNKSNSGHGNNNNDRNNHQSGDRNNNDSNWINEIPMNASTAPQNQTIDHWTILSNLEHQIAKIQVEDLLPAGGGRPINFQKFPLLRSILKTSHCWNGRIEGWFWNS